MDLQLAIVVSCTDAGCTLRLLDNGALYHAAYSEPMVEYGIRCKTGDLVAVDRDGDRFQMVFRWSLGRVEKVDAGDVYVRFQDGGLGPLSLMEGADQPTANDLIFAVNRQICDLVVNGRPAHPERLRRKFFPQIEKMYVQTERWNRLDPKQTVRDGYNRIAEPHAEWSLSARSEERAHYASIVLNALPPGAEVLDIGCGTCVPTTQELARRFRVTGVDLADRHIELARRNVPDARFIQADITELQLGPETFDGVVAFYSLIHVPRQEQPMLLQRIGTWLRPGGVFVATMGARSMNRDFGDDFFGTTMFWSSFDVATNRRLVEEAGLVIEASQVETAIEFDKPVRFLWVIAHKLESAAP